MELKGITLVYGQPGTGKTTFAAMVASRRLMNGESVFWVSFYEDRETLVNNMLKVGYDLGRANVWDAVLTDAESVFNYIVAQTSENAPSMLVIDSISQLQGLDRTHLTNVVYRALRPTGTDIVLIAEEEAAVPLNYIADNIIHLIRRTSEKGTSLRYADFEKIRGRPAGYIKVFDILEGEGIVFFDDISPSWRREGTQINTNISCIDKMLGGLAGGMANVFLAPPSSYFLRFLAVLASNLSKQGYRVFLAARTVDPARFSSYVEKLGGRIAVRAFETRPQAYWQNLYSLYKAIELARPDVVIMDWLDADFVVLGRDLALDMFQRIRKLLRETSVPGIFMASEDRGVSIFADNVVALSEEGGEIVANSLKALTFESTIATCKFRLQ